MSNQDDASLKGWAVGGGGLLREQSGKVDSRSALTHSTFMAAVL